MPTAIPCFRRVDIKDYLFAQISDGTLIKGFDQFSSKDRVDCELTFISEPHLRNIGDPAIYIHLGQGTAKVFSDRYAYADALRSLLTGIGKDNPVRGLEVSKFIQDASLIEYWKKKAARVIAKSSMDAAYAWSDSLNATKELSPYSHLRLSPSMKIKRGGKGHTSTSFVGSFGFRGYNLRFFLTSPLLSILKRDIVHQEPDVESTLARPITEWEPSGRFEDVICLSCDDLLDEDFESVIGFCAKCYKRGASICLVETDRSAEEVEFIVEQTSFTFIFRRPEDLTILLFDSPADFYNAVSSEATRADLMADGFLYSLEET